MDMLTNPEMKSSIHHHHLFVAIINITTIIIAASKDRVVGINLSTILTDKGHAIKVSATLKSSTHQSEGRPEGVLTLSCTSTDEILPTM